MDDGTEELLTKAESLKNMLIARATGAFPDNSEYISIRRKLTQHPLTKSRLPRFVRACRSLDEFWAFIQPEFGRYAERREYLREQFDELLTVLEESAHTPADAHSEEVLARVDFPHIEAAWHKALERRITDPEGAITAARSLLESTCKHILDEEGVGYGEAEKLPRLYGKVAKTLNLAPSQHAEEVFKRILGGCQTVVENLGALRNRLSDAHGKGKIVVRPLARHSGLAVNLAGTMATFLIETWEVRRAANRKRRGPDS